MGRFFLFILGLIGFIGVVATFCNNVIVLDAQKRLLSKKFENWWNIVKYYSRIKLALALAKKINTVLDSTFGGNHWSKQLVFRCFTISSGFLLTTLTLFGIRHNHPFGATPWNAYKQSVSFVLTTCDDLTSPTNYSPFTVVNITQIAPQINALTNSALINFKSNLFLYSLNTNEAYEVTRVYPFGNGELFVKYNRYFALTNHAHQNTNFLGQISTPSNPLDDLLNDLKILRASVARYDKPKNIMIYSIAFYVILFAINTLMFIGSLAFCRTILREIAKSGRLVTTCSLVFTNLAFIFATSCVLVLILTILAVPLFWLLIPSIYYVSEDSLYTVVAFLLSAAMTLLLYVGGSTKVILFIALLPSLFALLVGLFSLVAIKWRNAFHFVVKNLIIRCIEKNPIAVLAGTIAFAVALIGGATKLIHFLGFL